VVPEGGGGLALWRWGLFVLLLAGLWAGRREQALIPWLLLLTTKIVTTLGFYGYAREGAVVIPVFALLLGLLAVRVLPRFLKAPARIDAAAAARNGFRVSCMLALILIAVEAYRWSSDPVITLDGREPGAVDVLPGTEYEERRLLVK